jgi:hypothetical protein
MRLRDAACGYAVDCGWHVFPCEPKEKRPAYLVPRGYKEATARASDILHWWQRCPTANIGLSCRASGLLVLDIDTRSDGHATLAALEGELGLLPRTLTASTPTRGRHIFFQHPGDGPFRKTLGQGVDVKDQGYVLLSPSARVEGFYTWENRVAPVELPGQWLGSMVRNAVSEAPRSPSNAPLYEIPAEEYVHALAGVETVSGGWACCPFHEETKPSFRADGSLWCCYGACEPWGHKQIAGGNIVDFAALVWGYPVPLDRSDLAEVLDQLGAIFAA